jgi:aspartate 1-decarboxylase
MWITILKSKIHRATITDANLNYEGSLTIDENLMKAANIHEHEKVQVVNINNGHRFETYAIKGQPGSGSICLNGAAARLGEIGDKVIIITYVQLQLPLNDHTPIVVSVDDKNNLKL